MVRESLEVTSDQQQADDNVWDTTTHIGCGRTMDRANQHNTTGDALGLQ